MTHGPDQVIDDLRDHAADTRLGSDKAGTVGRVCTYLEDKNPYLDYATALARGRPIPNGIIEGACRHPIKDRFDITGARWSLPEPKPSSNSAP